jgi:hypothetical protein
VSPPIQTARYDADLLYKTNYTNSADYCLLSGLQRTAGPSRGDGMSFCKIRLTSSAASLRCTKPLVAQVAVRSLYPRVLGTPADCPIQSWPLKAGTSVPADTTALPLLIQPLRRLRRINVRHRQGFGGWSTLMTLCHQNK